jgi:hypothetical protein
MMMNAGILNVGPLEDALTKRYTGRPQSYERHFNRMMNAGFLNADPLRMLQQNDILVARRVTNGTLTK